MRRGRFSFPSEQGLAQPHFYCSRMGVCRTSPCHTAGFLPFVFCDQVPYNVQSSEGILPPLVSSVPAGYLFQTPRCAKLILSPRCLIALFGVRVEFLVTVFPFAMFSSLVLQLPLLLVVLLTNCFSSPDA